VRRRISWWCIFPAQTWRWRRIRAEAPCWKGEIQAGRLVIAWQRTFSARLVVGAFEDGERPRLTITQDEDGDFIVRDHDRNGCICHADTLDGAWDHYREVRALWDEASAKSAAAFPSGDETPPPQDPRVTPEQP
jgi:predicted RNase H-like HicB family nuclease